MSVQTSAPTYNVRYVAAEDRLLVSIDVPPDREFAMSLTRRLGKQLVGTLAAIHAKRREAVTPANPAARDTVLGFEHQAAVGAAVAGGDARKNVPVKTLVSAPRLILAVKITPKPDGGAVLVFDEGEKHLTLDLTPPRVHLFMAAIIDIATAAEWDLPPLAAWLEGSSLSTDQAAAKAVH
ncbi:MAG TPA: hypothetical protein VMU87_10310 [Stellaceae bacterium]|nr:hypothetical protein [Stellaceae bacterium]